MISVDTKYGPVTVVVPSGTLCRYLAFELDLQAVKVPWRSKLGRARGTSPAKNRNEPVRLSVTPYYFFTDDDQRIDENLILDLLAHDKPVVASLVCTKFPPFIPIIFKGETLDPTGKRMFLPYTWKELDGHRGLFGPVWGANGGSFLVKREVFDAIEYPWFRMGQTNPEDCQEDIYFYDQCRKAGIEVYVDLATRSGHISPVEAVPTQLPDGVWTIRLEFENEESVLLGRTDIPVPDA